ncbi:MULTISPECIES: fimbrial biogenesis chaperone [Pseudomonas]|uniref:fimbrial biogenesis chaperone n=1 Tax=Pseudomonas TaxID=286 RepID=UPI00235EB63B|nr:MULTISPECIES: molecular chaperone [Pseudomonas]WJV24463.1 molecular chaperone [Pseudomonas chlororaphis]
MKGSIFLFETCGRLLMSSLCRLLAALCFFYTTFAWSGVVMLGNRIIYPESASSTMINLRNTEDIPYVVQAWIDDGSANPILAVDVIPFELTPPLFRLPPKNQQVLRVRLLPNNLPSDRESLFWFNFQQIAPAVEPAKQARLDLSLIQQVKLLFRPRALEGGIAALPSNLKVRLPEKRGGVEFYNHSPYFANLTERVMVVDDLGQQWPLRVSALITIAPFSMVKWPLPSATNSKRLRSVRVELIGDQGAIQPLEYSLQ